jgi:signal transduction histidine kinase
VVSPFRSTAFRIALGQAAISLGALALMASVLWAVIAVRLDHQLTAIVGDNTRAISDLLETSGLDAARDSITERVGSRLDEDQILLLTDASFNRLAGNLPAWPIDAPEEAGWGTISIVRGGRFGEARVLHTILPAGLHLLAGLDLGPRNAMRAQFQAGLAGAGLTVVLTVIAGAWIFRRRFVARVAQIDAAARTIVAGQLQERLPVKDERNELDLLAGTINRMLDQIEQLIGGIRNVSNAIAHDLRTPLGELRTRLESLLLRQKVSGHAADEVEGAIEDTDRVIATFNALLRLAELDSGARRSGFVTVQIGAVMGQAVELYHPVAEAKSIALTMHAGRPVEVLGDPPLLAQAIANLVDNALKFAPAGSAVTVEADSLADGAITLTVADQGPGIPPDERPRVTERFFRGASSHGVQGVGLGLSMVSAIARLHGGEFRLEDNAPGLRAVLILPRSGVATA